MLVLAHVAGAALGEEMGGPSPYPAAALPSVPVQPGFGLLQVGGRCQSRRAAVLNRPGHFAVDGSAYRPRKIQSPAVTFHSFGTPPLEPRLSMQERNAPGVGAGQHLWAQDCGMMAMVLINAALSLALCLKISYSCSYCLPCGLAERENLGGNELPMVPRRTLKAGI